MCQKRNALSIQPYFADQKSDVFLPQLRKWHVLQDGGELGDELFEFRELRLLLRNDNEGDARLRGRIKENFGGGWLYSV